MRSFSSTVAPIGDFCRELLPNAYVFNASQHPVSSDNDFAIGIIIQPGPQTLVQTLKYVVTNPMSLANFWGHTGMYVREHGRIVRAIGYDPNRLRMFTTGLLTGETFGVSSGKRGTPGHLYDENTMLRSPDVICVEFKVARRLASQVLMDLPSPGVPTKGLIQYVTRSGKELKVEVTELYGNCIDFVQRILNKSHLSLMATEGFEFGSAQGRLTRAALRQQLVLQYTPKSKKHAELIQPTLIQMDGYHTLSRRVGGTLRSLAFASGLSQLTTLVGGPDAVGWLMGLIDTIVNGLLGYFGYQIEFPEFFLARTLFFIVVMLDFFIETATFKRMKSGAEVLSTVLTTGAVLAWVAALTGQEESATQMLMSYMLLIQTGLGLS